MHSAGRFGHAFGQVFGHVVWLLRVLLISRVSRLNWVGVRGVSRASRLSWVRVRGVSIKSQVRWLNEPGECAGEQGEPAGLGECALGGQGGYECEQGKPTSLGEGVRGEQGAPGALGE